MKAPLSLAACIVLTCHAAVGATAGPAAAEASWLVDANGCKFLNPSWQGQSPTATIQWTGQCVEGFVSGPGEVRMGPGSWLTYRGEFSQGRIEVGGLVRGTITGADGRTFEVDIEKDEILEVMKDGTKRPIDQLPADLTI